MAFCPRGVLMPADRRAAGDVEEPGNAERPIAGEPSVEEPGSARRNAEKPIAGEPGVEEPGSAGRNAEKPNTETPIAGEPGVEEPGPARRNAEKPIAGEPGVEEPGSAGRNAEAPNTETPNTRTPGVEEPEPARRNAETPIAERLDVEEPGSARQNAEAPNTDLPSASFPPPPVARLPATASLGSVDSAAAAADAPQQHAWPRVVLVGRPNVGKSTLFNRLLGQRRALESPRPGLTRDIREAQIEQFPYRYLLVDSGGAAFDTSPSPLEASIQLQAKQARQRADLLLLVVDGAAGWNPYDAALVQLLRQETASSTPAHAAPGIASGAAPVGTQRAQRAPLLVVVNKVDHPQRAAEAVSFYALGGDALVCVSASHRLGLDALRTAMVALQPALRASQASATSPPKRSRRTTARRSTRTQLPRDEAERPQRALAAVESAAAEAESAGSRAHSPVRFCLLGKPNVGKSSLANRLLGAKRLITSAIPGTTREAIEWPLQLGNHTALLVDTAGVKRRARTRDDLAKLSAVNTLAALPPADVIVLLIDASMPLSEQDARLAGYAARARRGVVVVFNKWDAVLAAANGGGQAGPPEAGRSTPHHHVGADRIEDDLRAGLSFLPDPHFVKTSALTGSGLEALKKALSETAQAMRRRLPTVDLNHALQRIQLRHPPPAKGRRSGKLYYVTQRATSPPRLLIFANDPQEIGKSTYRRHLEAQLRRTFRLRGVPLVLEFQPRSERTPAHRTSAPRPSTPRPSTPRSSTPRTPARNARRLPTQGRGGTLNPAYPGVPASNERRDQNQPDQSRPDKGRQDKGRQDRGRQAKISRPRVVKPKAGKTGPTQSPRRSGQPTRRWS